MQERQRNAISSLEWLDLAAAKRHEHTVEQTASLLIRSLNENYFSYGTTISNQRKHREIRSNNDYYGKGFFALPRIGLPHMRPDSNYIAWLPFIKCVYRLLDGSNKIDYIRELRQLENSLSGFMKSSNHPIAIEDALENILRKFEIETGFSSVIIIQPDDGNNGILSASQFKSLLRDGHPLDDNGAGAQHGRFSHRIQFYLLGQYMKKNASHLFSTDDISNIEASIIRQFPDFENLSNQEFINKLISIFYRLLGSDDFNNCFDWDEFNKRRQALSIKCNGQSVPDELNVADIWVQLFDRYGYAGYFSVPSTFGILQKIGLFSQMPKMGEPRVDSNIHLKRILDVTPHLT